jgi:hypothetical protein
LHKAAGVKMSDSASSGWLLKALAIGGAVVAVCWIISLVLGRMIGPLHVIAQGAQCQQNLARLTRGMRMYAQDYDDRFPPAADWIDRAAFFLDDPTRNHCPAVSKGSDARYGYAFNEALSGKVLAQTENLESKPLLYDSSKLEKSAYDRFSSLPEPGRHRARPRRGELIQRGNFVGYAGGSVKFVTDKSRSRNR